MDQASPSSNDNSTIESTDPPVMDNQAKPSDILVDVPLSLYWDEWSRCISSRYQRDYLYRVGRLDSCSRQWKDLKIVGRAKFLQYKDPETCKKMMDSTFYKKRTTISPTAGAIWQLKEEPGWD